jgi:hypothetical protein
VGPEVTLKYFLFFPPGEITTKKNDNNLIKISEKKKKFAHTPSVWKYIITGLHGIVCVLDGIRSCLLRLELSQSL